MEPDIGEFYVESHKVCTGEIHKPARVCVIPQIFDDAEHIRYRDGKWQDDLTCRLCLGLLLGFHWSVALNAAQEGVGQRSTRKGIGGCLRRFRRVFEEFCRGSDVHHVSFAGVYETNKVADRNVGDEVAGEEVEGVVGLFTEIEQWPGATGDPTGPGPVENGDGDVRSHLGWLPFRLYGSHDMLDSIGPSCSCAYGSKAHLSCLMFAAPVHSRESQVHTLFSRNALCTNTCARCLHPY